MFETISNKVKESKMRHIWSRHFTAAQVLTDWRCWWLITASLYSFFLCFQGLSVNGQNVWKLLINVLSTPPPPIVFFKDLFWFPCRKQKALIWLLTSSEVVFLSGLPYSAVWISDTSDWGTHGLLYFGPSQTTRAEINRKKLFSSVSSGSRILAYWTFLFTKGGKVRTVCPTCFFFSSKSHGSWRHPATKERANNLILSLFLCKVCSAKFINEVCLHGAKRGTLTRRRPRLPV